MKTLITLAFCLMTSVAILAQGYTPMPDSNAIWRTDWGNMSCTNLNQSSQYQYLLDGDTIMNSVIYKKITRSGYISPYCPPFSYGRPEIGYQGAYRNDVTNRKVYYVLPDSISEVLLYDFSMQVGDTVKGYFSLPQIVYCQNMIVSSIDTILLNNQPRKRYQIYGPGCETSFIEGIGSTHGLLENPITMEETGELICFKQNDTLIYLANLFNTCEVISGSSDLQQPEVGMTVSPNPADDYFTVSFNSRFEDINIEIVDMMGNCMLHEDFNGSYPLQFNISSWPSGIYILKMRSGERMLGTTKMIKK